MKGEHPVIGIFGHYGNRNLGDESIIQASIANVRARLPDAEVCCFSLRPEDTARRHGVESWRIIRAQDDNRPVRSDNLPPTENLPWNAYEAKLAQGEDPDNYRTPAAEEGLKSKIKGFPVVGRMAKAVLWLIRKAKVLALESRYLIKSYLYLRKFDLLVVSGSNQFLDNFGGAWAFPYTLLKWTLLAKLTGTRIAFASIGANPLAHRVSRFMICTALGLADYVSYRDYASKDIVEGEKAKFHGEVYPDLAFGLPPGSGATAATDGRVLVGINPMPVYDYRYWCVRDDSHYNAYVVKLARFAERLITSGYRIKFFGTMWRDDYVIVDVLQEMDSGILERMPADQLVSTCTEVSELMENLERFSIVVATRFHATLLPLLVGTPVLGISYYRKNVDLLTEFGQHNYHEVLESLDVDKLWGKFLELVGNLGVEQARIRRKVDEYGALIGQQWDNIVKLAH